MIFVQVDSSWGKDAFYKNFGLQVFSLKDSRMDLKYFNNADVDRAFYVLHFSVVCFENLAHAVQN